MRRLCRHAVLLSTLLLACPDNSVAQQQARETERFGLWVIGPNAHVRGWASQWIEDAVREAPTRPPSSAVLGWQTVLQVMLDVDAVPLGSPPEDSRRGGPMLVDMRAVLWPWDMEEPVPLRDRIERMREGRLTNHVQVLARHVPSDVGARDSLWILEAESIASWTASGPLQRRIVLATSRVVADSSLRTAARALGSQLAEAWADLSDQRSMRAR
jgi:hypothetical protein